MKKILFLAIIASSLFACNKQEILDREVEKGENTVTLTVQQVPISKGISDQKGSGDYAVIGSGKIYFIDVSGNNIYQRELTNTEIAALANTETTLGNKTVTITGIPNAAKTLFFVANAKTTEGLSYPMVEGTNGSDARLRIDKLQADVTHAPMSGQSGTFSVTGVNQVAASVTITPIVARLEIGKMTCHNQAGTGQPAVSSDITGYKLSGIFINNVRQSVLLSGNPYLVSSPIDIKAQVGWESSWSSYFAPGNNVFPYYNGGSVAVPSDWIPNAMVNYCTPTNSGLTFYPDATNGATITDPGVSSKLAWAYQVCPSTTVPAGSAADIPHIIIKLTDVAYVVPELSNPVQYITVTKYKDNSNNPVNQFIRGNVYRIDNLTFSSNETSNEPYQTDITVTATVSVAPWTINNINPDWN